MASTRARPVVLMAILFSILATLLVEAPMRSAHGGGSFFRSSEACLMKKINMARARHGRSALQWDRELGEVARRHAASMASRRAVFHDYDMGEKVTRWRRLGQNTGAGGACRQLFLMFMRSTKHRTNILGRWRHMGVGATWSGGRLYVQQIFESRRDPGNVY